MTSVCKNVQQSARSLFSVLVVNLYRHLSDCLQWFWC